MPMNIRGASEQSQSFSGGCNFDEPQVTGIIQHYGTSASGWPLKCSLPSALVQDDDCAHPCGV